MRTRLKLNFNTCDALRDVWERELKRGQLFIPSKRCLPVNAQVMLVIQVPEAPGPMELPGQVKVAREPQHCAANQRPGMGIEVALARRERKAAESYIEGDWAQAALVMGTGEEDDPGLAPSPGGASGVTRARSAAPPGAAVVAPRSAPLAAAVRSPSQPAVPGRAPASSETSSLGTRGPARRVSSGPADGSVVAVRRARPSESASAMVARSPGAAAAEFVAARRGAAPWEVLGVPRGADESAARRSYLALIKQFHPDRYFRKVDEAGMASLEEAYQLVTDAWESLTSGGARRG